MNLLPQSHQDFSQKEYWNNFFTKRGKKAFEWYGEYPELCEQLHKYINPRDDILVIGCGNSKLSMDLYDVGLKNITNIDISKVVIRQMQDTNKTNRPNMKYLQMDVLNMSFKDEEFSVILDKGTLDALMPNDEPATMQQIDKMFSEISRTIKKGGRYICISLLQEHILKKLLDYFPKNNFLFRVIRCHEAEKKTTEKGENSFAVFMVVCTKFHLLPHLILETCLAGDKMQRLTSPQDVLFSVLSVQEAAMICSGLRGNDIVGQDEVSFDLLKPDEPAPRYTIYVLDQAFDRRNRPYAAFVVPQGRETEWLFATKDGRKKLLETVHFNRLAIVIMHRNQIYDNFLTIKEELNSTILNLAPGKTENIPFISLGDDVGERHIVFEGKSSVSGPYVIEDVTTDSKDVFRRLIFLNNQTVVQSEAKLMKVSVPAKIKKKQQKLVPDPLYLACHHHIYMAIAVQVACSKKPQNTKQKNPETLENTSKKILLIGLGGGGLCTFINTALPDIKVSAVDIDPLMVKIAKEFFCLNTDNNNLDITIANGLDYIKLCLMQEMKFNAILFDVDCKDASLPISCPPKAFLSILTLDCVKSALESDGIFVLNLVLRDTSLYDSIIASLKRNFRTIMSYKLEQDVNEIFFCKVNKMPVKWKNDIKLAAEEINNIIKQKKKTNKDLINIDNFLGSLKLHT